MAAHVMVAAVPAIVWMTTAAPAVGAGIGTVQQGKTPPPFVFDIPPMSERVEIDGKKNPEMIPQWDVWHAAFDIMARRSDLPTEVHKELSKDEIALVLDAARENARNFVACQERVLQLLPTLKTDEARFINERTQAINLEFRWQVLRLRDRVLAALAPVGGGALSQYVESLKQGMRVFVPKRELAFYRQPQ
jgi:hypothetical protein